MPYDPFKHHRRSIRLKGYDYAGLGAYYITICAWGRECLFGEIIDGKMILNEFGRIVYEEWANTPEKRTNVILDVFVVMPNHMHGIFMITENCGRMAADIKPGETCGENPRCKGVLQYAPTHISVPNSYGLSPQTAAGILRSPSQTVGAIVRGFKGAAAKRINQLRDAPGSPVWQRNYYERIIRDQNEFDRIRQYIINNPLNWSKDTPYQSRSYHKGPG